MPVFEPSNESDPLKGLAEQASEVGHSLENLKKAVDASTTAAEDAERAAKKAKLLAFMKNPKPPEPRPEPELKPPTGDMPEKPEGSTEQVLGVLKKALSTFDASKLEREEIQAFIGELEGKQRKMAEALFKKEEKAVLDAQKRLESQKQKAYEQQLKDEERLSRTVAKELEREEKKRIKDEERQLGALAKALEREEKKRIKDQERQASSIAKDLEREEKKRIKDEEKEEKAILDAQKSLARQKQKAYEKQLKDEEKLSATIAKDLEQEEKKRIKDEEKLARAIEKDLEKEEKKQLKDQEKQQKDEEKLARAISKDLAKDQKKQEKDEEKQQKEGIKKSTALATNFSKLHSALKVIGNLKDVGLGLVAKASPNTAATFMASMDLLEARIGTFLIPTFETLAKAAQGTAKAIGAIPEPVKDEMGKMFKSVLLPGLGPISNLIEGTKSEKEKKEDAADRSFKGMGQPKVMGVEAFYNQMQLETLGNGPLELKLLRIEMENLTKILGGPIKGIEDNTAKSAAAFPTFR